jgi:CBS domain-containing protein/sporulation protein YlmC with PRC-barrel domain
VTNPFDAGSISFGSLHKHAVVNEKGEELGKLKDVVATLRGDKYPLVNGLLLDGRGGPVFVPACDIIKIDANRIELKTVDAGWQPPEVRDGDILLQRDLLGHRLIDTRRIALVKTYDVRLMHLPEGWIVKGLDAHRHRWFSFGRHEDHPARDWHDFLMIGDVVAQKALRASSRLRRLKPAHLADLLEEASPQEQNLLMAQVHADPELEADVFEELDDNKQAKILKSRSDIDVAAILSRMRADDAADAIMDLPQERRNTVLALLSQPQNKKVMTLLGYHDATAGGLMGTDYLALPEYRSIADALQMIREAKTQQPEALATIYSLHDDGTLAGTLGLVQALQLDPSIMLRDVADPDSVVASPEDDVIAVTTRMADFNLLTLPVVDADGRILGIITVDDALEVAIPRDWRQRKSGFPRAARRSATIGMS